MSAFLSETGTLTGDIIKICVRVDAHHSCLMPLDGSVGASCADVSASSIRWRIDEGRRGEESENLPGFTCDSVHLGPIAY